MADPSTYKYKCWFMNPYNKRVNVNDSTWCMVPSIGDILDGFWLNKHGQFTKSLNCKTWIAPASIRFVEKADDHFN